MLLYVLNQDLEIVGTVDEYESVIWNTSYNGVGDFELYLQVSSQLVDLLKVNRYIIRQTDITVNEGAVTYNHVMIIKNLTLSTYSQQGDYYLITGRELKYLLHQRIVWSQTNLTGSTEDAIRQLVDENAINPTDTKRVIPRLVLADSNGYNDTIEKQITGDYLDEAISEICESVNYGWDMNIVDGEIVFYTYQGLDRSYNQTVRPYVVFGNEFENITSSEYQYNSDEYANCALIGGEGEGTDRIRTTVNDELEKLERYEIFVDARDLSQNKGTDEEITLEEYQDILKERGRDTLEQHKEYEMYNGEVENYTFELNVDYFLGDIVTVKNEYGISKNVRVISIIETNDSSGHKIIPEFKL